MTPNELEAYSGTSADLARVQVAMSALMNLVMLYDKAHEAVELLADLDHELTAKLVAVDDRELRRTAGDAS